MEQNLNNIQLNDIEELDYGTHYSFYKMFRNNNIWTVGQVLDDKIMNSLIQQCKSRDTRSDILSFISLVRYKYCNVLIPQDILLDTEIKTEDDKDVLAKLGFHFRQLYYVNDIVKIREGKKVIDYFVDALKNGYFQNENNLKRNFPKKAFKCTEYIVRMYVESYAKTHGLNNMSELDELLSLKKELDSLTAVRDNLDLQIKELQQKTDEIEDVDKRISSLQNQVNSLESKEKSGRK